MIVLFITKSPEPDKLCSGIRLVAFLLNQRLPWFYSTFEPPLEGETAIFLHGQEKIWKGLINMQSVAKFVTKAYLVSGSFEHLKEVSKFGQALDFISILVSVKNRTVGNTCMTSV